MAGEWKRLTQHGRRAVRASQELAHSLAAAMVQPEHLLLALLDDGACTAQLLLSLAGVPIESMQTALDDCLAEDPSEPTGPESPPFSPDVRSIVERAGLLAEKGTIGTEQLLIAALQQPGRMSEILAAECGVRPEGLIVQLRVISSHELSERVGEPASPPVTTPAATRGPAAAPPFRVAEPQPTLSAGRDGLIAPAGVGQAPPEPAGAVNSVQGSVHTVLALARLIVDLSQRASNAARTAGKASLADQLDRLRFQAEAQIKASRPSSPSGDMAPKRARSA